MRAEDNHTLSRTDAGTPMGALFRRYSGRVCAAAGCQSA
jgi:hypothetical protein